MLCIDYRLQNSAGVGQSCPSACTGAIDTLFRLRGCSRKPLGAWEAATGMQAHSLPAESTHTRARAHMVTAVPEPSSCHMIWQETAAAREIKCGSHTAATSEQGQKLVSSAVGCDAVHPPTHEALSLPPDLLVAVHVP